MKKIKSIPISVILSAAYLQSAEAAPFSDNNLTSPVFQNSLTESVDITVQNGTTINTTSGGGTGIIQFTNVQGSASITNAGTLTNSTNGIDGISLGSGITNGLTGATINNSGTISATGTGARSIVTSNATSTSVTNSGSGAITGNILASDGSLTVNNSATITGNLTASNGTLNVTNSSTLTGDLVSTNGNINLTINNGSNISGTATGGSGSTNVLNVAQTSVNPLSLTSFTSIMNGQLVGTWQRNASTGSQVAIANGETYGTTTGTRMSINGGAVTNAGTLTLLGVSSGSLDNTTGTATINSLSGGAVDNRSTLTTGSITGGTLVNRGTLTLTSDTISNATVTNIGGTIIDGYAGSNVTVDNNSVFTNTGGDLTNHTQFNIVGGSTFNNENNLAAGVNGTAAVHNLALGNTGGTVNNDGKGVTNGATVDNVAMNGGTFNNSNRGLVSYIALLSDGTFNNNANSNVTTIADLSATGTFNNAGTVNLSEQTGGTFNNNSGGVLTTANINGGALNNAGTLTTVSLNVGGSGATLTNTNSVGTVNFNQGTINNASGTISSLKLMDGQPLGNIANNGTITSLSNGTNGTSNIAYGNVLSGTGTINKTGTGRLEITGVANTHSGTFNVNAGELKVNGITQSQVIGNSGSTVSGTGTVGSLTMNSGSTLAPGNSIGTLNVVGDVNLNSGSTSQFEYNETSIDKVISQTGNVNIADNTTMDFSLYNTPGGYFVVDQNIFEADAGTVNGQFTTVTTPEDYVADLQYSTHAVRATVARKLDSNVLDGSLASENNIGRIVNKTITDKLNYNDSKKAKVWISTGKFDNGRDAVANSSKYSTDGIITTAGVIKEYGKYDLTGVVYNAKSYVKRYTYTGNNEIDTNGIALGVGKKIGQKLYVSGQIGAGIYGNNSTRNVNVNGANQQAQSFSKGNLQYASVTGAYKIPVNMCGQFELFASARVQRTRNGSSKESGLTAGNLNFSKSSANTLNYEVGAAYSENFIKAFHLPANSFYRVEVTGSKSNIFSKDDATVSMGSAKYNLGYNFEEAVLYGAGGLISVPVVKNTNFVLSANHRQNGRYHETNGNLGFEVLF